MCVDNSTNTKKRKYNRIAIFKNKKKEEKKTEKN